MKEHIINNITSYYVYIVQCSDTTLYTGITTNIERRLHEHNTSSKGAKYTRNRRPVILMYSEECENKSIASKREYQIKKLTRENKLKLIDKYNCEKLLTI